MKSSVKRLVHKIISAKEIAEDEATPTMIEKMIK